MIKVLFLIHDLGQGGAEKVLVNLVNNMDKSKFNITVMALFGGGVNEQFLKNDIRYITVFPKAFPGNSHVMKLFSPTTLHKWFIKEKYDIEVSYLEGPPARIISGCFNEGTKLISWIHRELRTMKDISTSFRSKKEAVTCYNRFDQTVFVSQHIEKIFCKTLDFNGSVQVLYNTVESEKIKELAKADVAEYFTNKNQVRLIAVGTLKEVKGYERLLRIVNRLKEEYSIHLFILGIGPLQGRLEMYIKENDLNDYVTLLGYHTNPYKFVKNSDLFICASYAEGFSTATTEALIVGTPVCTVEVSGMKEMLGEQNEYGVVTANNEEALYLAIKKFLDYPELLTYYQKKAEERGHKFNVNETVKAVEETLSKIMRNTNEKR